MDFGQRPARRMGSGSRAFTLIEVCLAIGILSFALILMVGLLPSGLGQLTSSIDSLRAQAISRQVLVGAQQTDFNTLKSMGTYSLYFDYSGNQLQQNGSDTIYTAIVTIDDNAELPGTSTSQSTLLKVVIEVRKTQGGVDNAQNRAIENTVSYVACSDLSLLTGVQ